MNLYRFSPIKNKEELLRAVEYVHFESHKLCEDSFGRYLPVSGNVGVFCHYEEEYEYLTKVREELTEESENFNQKYFKLYEPINIPVKDGIPGATYEFLYIRQPDPYRHHVGDIDFFLNKEDYEDLKQSIQYGKIIKGARVFPSPRLDMIELFDSDSDVLAYVSTHMMSDIVRNTKSGT